MTRTKPLIALAIAATLASGCSTKPRHFAPTLSAPADHSVRLEDDVRICDALVRQGRTSGFAAAAASAAATGVGTVGSGMAMVGTGMVGIGSSGAGAAAATFAMPVVGLLAGFGVSRAIRGGKERKYKTRMETCLTELGYTTDGWQKIAKRADPGAEAIRLAKFETVAQLNEQAPATASNEMDAETEVEVGPVSAANAIAEEVTADPVEIPLQSS